MPKKKPSIKKENMDVDESQYDMIKKLELPFEYFREIQMYCKKKEYYVCIYTRWL